MAAIKKDGAEGFCRRIKKYLESSETSALWKKYMYKPAERADRAAKTRRKETRCLFPRANEFMVIKLKPLLLKTALDKRQKSQ
ncbi:MAG: hypothetical protein ACLFQ9_06130 [Desulfobacterales bacterium]